MGPVNVFNERRTVRTFYLKKFATKNPLETIEKSSICKLANAAIKSELSSGKSCPTNTVSTLLELTMETVIFNWKESMFIIMKPQVVNMSPVLFLWIWNPELWTQSDLDLTDKYSDQITLYLDSLEQETTGQKATTQKELNL